MSEIVWKDPPPKTGVDFIATLRENPDRWALYPRVMGSASCSVYRKNYPGTEWTSRKREDGKYDWYCRWVGEAS